MKYYKQLVHVTSNSYWTDLRSRCIGFDFLPDDMSLGASYTFSAWGEIDRMIHGKDAKVFIRRNWKFFFNHGRRNFRD